MKLPEIYKQKIDNDLRNNKYTYMGNGSSNNDLYLLNNLPVDVYLETKTKKLNTTIVGKTNNYVVTKGRDVIYIKDITILKRL